MITLAELRHGDPKVDSAPSQLGPRSMGLKRRRRDGEWRILAVEKVTLTNPMTGELALRARG